MNPEQSKALGVIPPHRYGVPRKSVARLHRVLVIPSPLEGEMGGGHGVLSEAWVDSSSVTTSSCGGSVGELASGSSPMASIGITSSTNAAAAAIKKLRLRKGKLPPGLIPSHHACRASKPITVRPASLPHSLRSSGIHNGCQNRLALRPLRLRMSQLSQARAMVTHNLANVKP